MNIVHQHYPGFIDLVPNAVYLVVGAGLRGGVQILKHVRPVIVTDFDNGFRREETPDGAVYTRLRKPIADVSDDCNVIDATGFEGRSAPAIIIEKGREGRIFYQDIFTELQTLTEFHGDDPSQGLVSHGHLVDRFVSTYRYLNRDLRIEMPAAIPTETTPIRVGHYVYSDAERLLPFHKRIAEASPGELNLSISAIGRGARALQDHDVDSAELERRSRTVNDWAASGFELGENLTEVERLADLANSGRRRAAVVEAVSIFEVGLLQARDRLSPGDKGRSSRNIGSEDLTLKALVNRVLPYLLKQFDGDPCSLIKRANELRELRNDVVHKRHEPDHAQVGEALTTVHTILAILDLPDLFKANWKRRID